MLPAPAAVILQSSHATLVPVITTLDLPRYFTKTSSRVIPGNWSKERYALRQVSLNMVESVKAIKHLHKNLSRNTLFSHSSAARAGS